MQDKSNHETAIVKRLKKYLDPSVFRFLLVGLVNTLFGTAIMFVFYNVFHFGYWFSSASNYVLVSILSYFLNKNYTFRSPVRGGVRFFVSHAIYPCVICWHTELPNP